MGLYTHYGALDIGNIHQMGWEPFLIAYNSFDFKSG